jgi:hypothetical protein
MMVWLCSLPIHFLPSRFAGLGYIINEEPMITQSIAEPYLERLRRLIEEQYKDIELGSGTVGGCFGSILCHELHFDGGLHFIALAKKWGIPVTTLGELIYDHCKRLEEDPVVQHNHRGTQ